MRYAATAPRTAQAMAKETAASRDLASLHRPGSAPAANVLRDLLEQKPPAGHGRPQCHAGLVFRRRPLSRSGSRHRPGAAPCRRRRRHPRYRRGIDAALWQCGRGAARRGTRAPCRHPAGRGRARHPGLDRHHEGRRRRLGARGRRRRSSTTCGGCSAIPTWRTSSPSTMCRSSSCTIARPPIRAIDIVADVTAFFARSLDIAARAGIARERIVLDPGIGFGKTPEQSMTCIARLDAWRGFGLPLLVGASRKRFIHSVDAVGAGRSGSAARSPRISWRSRTAPPSCASHDVAPTVQALRVAAAIEAGAMSDAIFINGLALHAYHGVMPHEAKVGQTFTLDLDARHRSCRRLAHRQAQAHRLLRQGGADGERGVLLAPLSAGRGRRRRASPRRCWSITRRCASIRVTVHKPHAPIAATFDDVGVVIERAARTRARQGLRPWPKRSSRSAAMSATCAQPSTARCRMLCDGTDVRLTARSSDYRTPPWGFNDQPPFINAVIAVATTLAPARAAGARPEPANARSAATARMKSTGGRAPSISTSWPMTISSSTTRP